MKKLSMIIILLISLLCLPFSFADIKAANNNEINNNKIIIEGITDGEVASKPNIKFYILNPDVTTTYQITFDNNETFEFSYQNNSKSITLPLSKDGNIDYLNPYVVINNLKSYNINNQDITIINQKNEELTFSIKDGIIDINGYQYTNNLFEKVINQDNLLITKKDGSYYVDDLNSMVSVDKQITAVSIIKEEKNKIVSATLNDQPITTNTTLKATMFDNGEYILKITDSLGNVKTITFTLNNEAYISEVIKALLEGTKNTIIIFVVTLLFSLPLGLMGCLFKKVKFTPFKKIKNCKFNPLKFILDIYTWVIRGTPLLLQLFVVYFGLPIIFGEKFSLAALPAACITFVINYAAYFIEIFRGGLETINKGQFDACYVLGMSKFQTYIRIIIPQTIKKVLPSITNEAITLVKDTALASVITIADLLFFTKQKVSLDFRMDAYFVAAIIYLVFSLIIVFIFRKIEKKYSYYN